MSFTKIGPFLQKNSTNVNLINAPMVKLLDPSIETIKLTRASVGPNTWIVVRKFFKYQPLTDPVGEAFDWCNIFLPYVTRGLDKRVVFEGYNEISEADTEKNALFEGVRQDFLHTYGYGGVYGNHSVGNLNNDNAKPYQGLINNFSNQDFFGWHSYWGTKATVLNPWHTMRWSLIDLLKDVPAFITECGRDYVKDKNLPQDQWGRRGWKLGGISEADYLTEISTFSDALDTSPNIAGAALFLVGPCESQWNNYQSEEVYRKIKLRQQGNYFYEGGVVEPLPPVVDPEDEIKKLLDASRIQLTEAQKLIGDAENNLTTLEKLFYGK